MDRFDEIAWLEFQTNSFFEEFLDGWGEGEVLTMQCLERDRLLEPHDTIPERHGTGHVGSCETKLRARRRPVEQSFARVMKRLQQTGLGVFRGQVHTQPLSAPAGPSSWKPSWRPPRMASEQTAGRPMVDPTSGSEGHIDGFAPHQPRQSLLYPYQLSGLLLGSSSPTPRQVVGSWWGAPGKATWHPELSVVEILVSPDPASLATEVYEFVPIVGIVHQGHDQQGHLQGVGRTTKGWGLFDDGKELGCQPQDSIPRPADWTCVWLIRNNRRIEVTPFHYTRGHDAKVHPAVQLSVQRSWQELELREDLAHYFAVHCGACSQIFTDVINLARHVFQWHFAPCWTLTRPAVLYGPDHRGSDTPWLMCAAMPCSPPDKTFGAPRLLDESGLNSLGFWLAMDN